MPSNFFQQVRTMGRSENPGVPVLCGGHNLPSWLKWGALICQSLGVPLPGTPGTPRNDTPACRYVMFNIELINNKARHNLINAKCRWLSDRLDGAGSFWEKLGQTQVMQFRQMETPNQQGAITHEIFCLSCQ